jgi:hypothetical protein
MNPLDAFMHNNVNSYIYKLGHFWQSFNNMELMLRLYLHRKSGGDQKDFLKYSNAAIGTELPENPITDYRSFWQLCNAFNVLQDVNNKIDFSEFIELRDALAHGRVSGDNLGNMDVIKYTRSKNGQVKVEYKKQLTKTDIERITDRMARVSMEVSSRMGSKMPDDFVPNKSS